jgi:UPF0755 protein
MRALFSSGMTRRRSFLRGLVAFGFLVLYTFWGFVGYFQAQGTFPSQFFVVADGESLKSIGARLQERGIIPSSFLFRWGIFFSGREKHLRSGDYFIVENESPYRVAHLLLTTQGQQYKVTIPEGLTNYQTLALLKSKPFLKDDHPLMPPEGMLYPETYIFSKGTTLSRVIAEMKHMMDLKLQELWEKRQQDLPFESPEEALILASIVEREAFIETEKPLIASVYLNRLKIGMPLQADPTVVYALSNGRGDLGRLLLRKDLCVDHPFNTYKIKGLPPMPIANPSFSSLKAVLVHPEKTDALYFVADGRGGHRFSKHYHHHRTNILKLRRMKRKSFS